MFHSQALSFQPFYERWPLRSFFLGGGLPFHEQHAKLAKLLGILVLNALQLRTLFGLFKFFGFVTDEYFVDETRVWRILNLVLVSMMSLFTASSKIVFNLSSMFFFFFVFLDV